MLPLQLEANVIGLVGALVEQRVRFVAHHLYRRELLGRVTNGLGGIVLGANNVTVWNEKDQAGCWLAGSQSCRDYFGIFVRKVSVDAFVATQIKHRQLANMLERFKLNHFYLISF